MNQAQKLLNIVEAKFKGGNFEVVVPAKLNMLSVDLKKGAKISIFDNGDVELINKGKASKSIGALTKNFAPIPVSSDKDIMSTYGIKRISK